MRACLGDVLVSVGTLNARAFVKNRAFAGPAEGKLSRLGVGSDCRWRVPEGTQLQVDSDPQVSNLNHR